MIKRKINGKQTEIPTNWGDISFAQYLDIMETGNNPRSDHYDILAICLKTTREELMKAQTDNVFELVQLLSFTGVPAVVDPKPRKLLQYILPKDITLESLGQFEDMRRIMREHGAKEGDTPTEKIVRLTKAYPKYAAIYCQKIRDGEYDYDKAMEMEKEFWNASCLEVISAGSFFLISLSNSFSSTQKTALQRVPVWKRSRLVLLSLEKRGASIWSWIRSAAKPVLKKTSL